MKKLYFVMALLVVASMVLAACNQTTPVSNQTAILESRSTPEPTLRPAIGYDAILQIRVVYSENSGIASTWLDSYWFINEPAGDTPSVTPDKIRVTINKDFDDTVDVTPNVNKEIGNGRPEEYKIKDISVVNWTCDRRGLKNTWDCKFNK